MLQESLRTMITEQAGGRELSASQLKSIAFAPRQQPALTCSAYDLHCHRPGPPNLPLSLLFLISSSVCVQAKASDCLGLGSALLQGWSLKALCLLLGFQSQVSLTLVSISSHFP